MLRCIFKGCINARLEVCTLPVNILPVGPLLCCSILLAALQIDRTTSVTLTQFIDLRSLHIRQAVQ